MKRLPPFGAIVAGRLLEGAYRRWGGTSPDGTTPQLWVAEGPLAWHWANARIARRLVMACPEKPDSFDWRLCRGHDVLLVATGGLTDDTDALAIELLKVGAGVLAMTPKGNLTRYRANG